MKAYRPGNWPALLDEYDQWAANPASVKQEPKLERLVRQVKSGRDAGRKVYVAVSDGMSRRSRDRLLAILKAHDVRGKQLIWLPEAEILRVGARLREHLGIRQPAPPIRGSK